MTKAGLSPQKKQQHSMHIHVLELQIHPLDFHSVPEIYPLKSKVRSEYVASYLRLCVYVFVCVCVCVCVVMD